MLKMRRGEGWLGWVWGRVLDGVRLGVGECEAGRWRVWGWVLENMKWGEGSAGLGVAKYVGMRDAGRWVVWGWCKQVWGRVLWEEWGKVKGSEAEDTEKYEDMRLVWYIVRTMNRELGSARQYAGCITQDALGVRDRIWEDRVRVRQGTGCSMWDVWGRV